MERMKEAGYKISFSPCGSHGLLAVMMTYTDYLLAFERAGQLIMARIQGLDVLHIHLGSFDKQGFLKLSCPHTC